MAIAKTGITACMLWSCDPLVHRDSGDSWSRATCYRAESCRLPSASQLAVSFSIRQTLVIFKRVYAYGTRIVTQPVRSAITPRL